MKRLAVILAPLWLAACVTPPPPPPQPAPEPTPTPEPVVYVEHLPSEVDAVLAYGARVRNLTAAELARELAALAGEPSGPDTTLKRALVLSRMHGNGELARAIGLLDALGKSTEEVAAPFKPLAAVLQAQFNERRKLEDQADRLAQQVKDEQRRADEANAKVEALKKIESTLPARPSAPATK
ncbi:hypothetical protein GCM10007860_33970 [Chitiniphilus shinanonensis]|uniref:Lipoprotein n=1 Tax=Chitiniphilus shinanonensis TaxID=553088 RepID=A0ABQ6BXX3_9NEIS|nr:hypothetical protein [Chitiniphilus shinanonensis]GLS06227.1 hypothetical protein GCM10007860_33970 [Chitiniphilus shinanonensis]